MTSSVGSSVGISTSGLSGLVGVGTSSNEFDGSELVGSEVSVSEVSTGSLESLDELSLPQAANPSALTIRMGVHTRVMVRRIGATLVVGSLVATARANVS